MDRNKTDRILEMCAQLSIEEMESLSKELKKMLFRCRVQEKIDLRREDVAQRLSESMTHRMNKTGGD